MGAIIDTVGFHATKPTAAGAAAVVSAGDSFTMRNFPTTSKALLCQVGWQNQDTVLGFVQIKSPRLANVTTGIKLVTLENPTGLLLPPYGLQGMYPGDVLTVNIAGTTTTAHTTSGYFQVYYTTLPGSDARLHNWGDISGIIENVFTQQVAVDVATAGTWVTQLANHTATLMAADTTYALLGYTVEKAYMCVGLKAQETGNYRIVGPGVTRSEVTSAWFVNQSNKLGLPYIPVVNANNRGNINVTANGGLAVTSKVGLIWAELSASVS
jgi:hypothetical protein